MKHILIFVLIISALKQGDLQAQTAYSSNQSQELNNLPKSFLIGEYEQPYEQLINNYNQLLLTVCNNDMSRAYDIWAKVLSDMEDYSKQMNFNLNGLKLWMNMFFNADGTIQHIVYFPKPNSRNMQFEQLTAFLTSFCKYYNQKVPVAVKCSHYGSASFPIFDKR